MKRLLGAFLAAIGAVATLAAPVPAYAAAGDLTCTVSSVVTYSPGLTLTTTTQYITFSVHYNGCTSTTGATVSTATIGGSYYADRSCLSAPPAGDVAFTIPWNDSTSSDVEGTASNAIVGGESVYSTLGTVTSGRFTADTFLEVITESTLNLLACATTGVTSQTGVGVVTFG